jgi:hypothetical protein
VKPKTKSSLATVLQVFLFDCSDEPAAVVMRIPHIAESQTEWETQLLLHRIAQGHHQESSQELLLVTNQEAISA